MVTNFITDEQIQIAEDELSDNLKLYMMFSLSTAIRIEDLLILKWDQIDIEERTVHIDDKILYFNEEVAEMLQKEKIMNLMIMVMYSEDNMKIQNLYQKT